MNLPQWNNEWDPPDALKGRMGWNRHHYLNRLFFVFVFLGLVGLLIPGAFRVKQVQSQLEMKWERQPDVFHEKNGKGRLWRDDIRGAEFLIEMNGLILPND